MVRIGEIGGQIVGPSITGASGAPGVQGMPGLSGTAGVNGTNGTPGAMGMPGLSGPAGAAGSSAAPFRATYGTQVVLASSIVETTVFPAVAIGAAQIGANGSLKLQLLFDLCHFTACNTTIRFYYGATVIASIVYSEGTVDPIKPTEMFILIGNTNSQSAQRFGIDLFYTDGTVKWRRASGTSAANTAVGQNFSITVQHSVSNANNIYTQYYVVMELLN